MPTQWREGAIQRLTNRAQRCARLGANATDPGIRRDLMFLVEKYEQMVLRLEQGRDGDRTCQYERE